MTPEELKKLAGDAKPNTLKEWLVEWKAWAIYRTATGREASITPRGRRELATLILLDGLLGPECEDKNCEDYDGEHPYHENVGVRMHEEGQRKLRADLQRANARIQELEQARNFDLKYQGTVTGQLSAAQPNLSNPPKPGPGRREQMTGNFGKMYFLNEAHELPPISKKQVRRERDAKRLEKERDKLKTSLSEINKGPRKYTASEREKMNALKESIRRLNKRIKNLRTPKTESMKIEAKFSDTAAWVLEEKK